MRARRSSWINEILLFLLLISGVFLGVPGRVRADVSQPPGIEISEIDYDAPGSDTGQEWVELVNSSDQPVTIQTGSGSSAWRFFDTAPHTFKLIQGSALLEAGTFAILTSEPDTFLVHYPSFTGTIFKVALHLPNSQATLKLSTDGGKNWFGQRSYAQSDGAAGDGHTLAWQNADWHADGPLGGTPGAAAALATENPQPQPDVTPTPSPASQQPDEPSAPTPPSAPVSIAISEIYYDAPGSDTGQEWIEVINQGASDLTIHAGRAASSWRMIVNANRHILTLTQGSPSINPKQRFIIAANSDTFLREHPTYAGTVLDSSFSLPNTIGTLGISLDSQSDPITSSVYTSEWGAAGNGRSLEMDGGGAWHESIPGGTPGGPPLQPSSPGTSNEPSPAPTSPAPTPTTTPSPAPLPTPTLAPPLPSASLIFNEINYNPAGADNGREWLELYNTGERTVKLPAQKSSGWRLSVNGKHHILAWSAGPQSLAPGEFALILPTKTNPGGYPPSVPILSASFSLSNSGANLKLSTDDGASWLANVDYLPAQGGNGDGRTLERTAAGQWRASQTLGGSPGTSFASETNPASAEVFMSEIGLKPTGSDLTGQWVELCSSASSAIDLANWRLSESRAGTSGYLFRGASPIILPARACQAINQPVTEGHIHLQMKGGELNLIDPSGRTIDHMEYTDWPAGAVWNRPNADHGPWSQQATPNAPNVYEPLEEAGPSLSWPPAALYDQTTATVIDQEQPRSLLAMDMSQTVPMGSFVSIAGRVQTSRAKSLALDSGGERISIHFQLPAHTKPSIHAGEFVTVAGVTTSAPTGIDIHVVRPEDISINSKFPPTRKPNQAAERPSVQIKPVTPPAVDPLAWTTIAPRGGLPDWTDWLLNGMIAGILLLTVSCIRPHGRAPHANHFSA